MVFHSRDASDLHGETPKISQNIERNPFKKKTGCAAILKTAGGEQAPFCQCLSQKSGKTKLIKECMVRHAGAATMMGHSWGALRRYIQ